MPNKAKLDGIICASVTPVNAEFRIDGPALAHHCRRVLDEGCSYVSVFGTTGEGASLAAAEKIDAVHRLIEDGVPAARQVPAIMSPVLTDAAEMLAGVEAAGCRAALVLPPFYYPDPGKTGVLAFFDALLDRAASTDIDLVLYNIPRLSRISYTPELVQALLDRFGTRIVGIKDSTGDLDNSRTLARGFPDLAVFTGDDRVMPDLRLAGGAGMIGGMPNLFAADAVAVLDAPDAPDTAELRHAAARRIEVVDGNGGIPPVPPLDDAVAGAVLAGLAETGYDPDKAA